MLVARAIGNLDELDQIEICDLSINNMPLENNPTNLIVSLCYVRDSKLWVSKKMTSQNTPLENEKSSLEFTHMYVFTKMTLIFEYLYEMTWLNTHLEKWNPHWNTFWSLESKCCHFRIKVIWIFIWGWHGREMSYKISILQIYTCLL